MSALQNLGALVLANIVSDCVQYAREHNCSFEDALNDWEADGPSGSWGLTADEKAAILASARATILARATPITSVNDERVRGAHQEPRDQ